MFNIYFPGENDKRFLLTDSYHQPFSPNIKNH
jgi:hypothetical protein